jgi:GT2 family glycosyltransferase
MGDIIAYTDDDVIADRRWVRALVQVFARNPRIMAVTGLVVPAELETKAQILFERYGGFGRGFEQRWFHVHQTDRNVEPFQLGAGAFGTGANMAYRRSLFTHIGGFDPALDVGTASNGGGDLEMFFRLLHEGHILVYEPRAIVRHRHRQTYPELRTQLTNHGIGLYAFFCRCFLAYPALRIAILRFGLWWLWFWNVRRPLRSLIRHNELPRELMMTEFVGSLIGALRYPRARRVAGTLRQRPADGDRERTAVDELSVVAGSDNIRVSPDSRAGVVNSRRPLLPCPRYPVAVRQVELADTISDMTDMDGYRALQIYVTAHGELLGNVMIDHVDAEVSAERIRQSVSKAFGPKLLASDGECWDRPIWARAASIVAQEHGPRKRPASGLSSDKSVSIVIATRDRPNDLLVCLTALHRLRNDRRVEIIVVDNNPPSGLTPPVVKQFTAVSLINEVRRGSSYARNAGVKASSGEIIVMIDDDVTVPPDWLERLLTHFSRPDVMVVTGNVLPLELETHSQVLFETYGGLGRGFERFEANRDWLRAFKSAPRTWMLGATANVAFRADVFRDQRVGLFEEALGAGMAGVGEDTYMFYRILHAGCTLVYEPSAYVLHKHRRDAHAFRRQIYTYSKGHVAYHLTTLFRNGDLRVIVYLLFTLPRTYLFRTKARLLRRSVYPLSLLALEFMGNLAGPWAYVSCWWKTRRSIFNNRRYDTAKS